jgi:hypothetical protein
MSCLFLGFGALCQVPWPEDWGLNNLKNAHSSTSIAPLSFSNFDSPFFAPAVSLFF